MQKHNDEYIDPTNYNQYLTHMLNDQHIVNNDEKYLDEDWDSQDSNREDHDDFEYPEGEKDDEYGNCFDE